jgi:hypothetical protein
VEPAQEEPKKKAKKETAQEEPKKKAKKETAQEEPKKKAKKETAQEEPKMESIEETPKKKNKKVKEEEEEEEIEENVEVDENVMYVKIRHFFDGGEPLESKKSTGIEKLDNKIYDAIVSIVILAIVESLTYCLNDAESDSDSESSSNDEIIELMSIGYKFDSLEDDILIAFNKSSRNDFTVEEYQTIVATVRNINMFTLFGERYVKKYLPKYEGGDLGLVLEVVEIQPPVEDQDLLNYDSDNLHGESDSEDDAICSDSDAVLEDVSDDDDEDDEDEDDEDDDDEDEDEDEDDEEPNKTSDDLDCV